VVQQRFERRNRSADQQLLLKVGLSVGDATAKDGDYFGTPVTEAAGLCARCTAGQILAQELIAHLAAGRGFEFNAVGELELSDFPDPLAAVEVCWQRLGDEGISVPLPPGLREALPGEFVGRAAEAAQLHELFAKAVSGERRLALLSGEPGIGKTQLATHLALQARASDAVILYGACDEVSAFRGCPIQSGHGAPGAAMPGLCTPRHSALPAHVAEPGAG
jgi:AAA ATPase domain